jgi:hypothetical protein
MVTAQAQHRAVMLLVEVKSLQCVFDFFRKSDDLQAVRSLVLTPTVSEVLCYLSSSLMNQKEKSTVVSVLGLWKRKLGWDIHG